MEPSTPSDTGSAQTALQHGTDKVGVREKRFLICSHVINMGSGGKRQVPDSRHGDPMLGKHGI